MKINKTQGAGAHFMNEHNMVVASTWDSRYLSMSHGVGDSVGRTAMSALIYDEDKDELLMGLMSNFHNYRTSPEKGYEWYITRYPQGEMYATVGCSRDHAMYALSSLIQVGYDGFVKEYLTNRAKRPSIQYGYTFLQKVWFKALFSKFWSNVLAGLMIPFMVSMRPIKRHINTFMLFYYLWGIQAIKGGKAKIAIQKAMLPLFEESNYVARLLCGDSITEEEFKAYVPTRSFRWTTRLDNTDRDMTLYPDDTPENNVELGLLHYLYNKQK